MMRIHSDKEAIRIYYHYFLVNIAAPDLVAHLRSRVKLLSLNGKVAQEVSSVVTFVNSKTKWHVKTK